MPFILDGTNRENEGVIVLACKQMMFILGDENILGPGQTFG
jgi:hypothetical protein